MKFSEPIPIKTIAHKIGATIIGNADLVATGINEIHKVEKGDITFVDIKKYFKKSLESAASIIILNEATDCPKGKALLLCEQPFEAYNNLVLEHRPFRPLSTPIASSAVIHPSAIIEPNVIIGPNVRIGQYAYVQANVTIHEYSVIGDHVTIQSGTVIGADAFYFKRYGAKYKKWHSGGRVIIEDQVYVGPNCSICRGVSGDTVIGEGSKLDGLVHLGHGVVLGKNCLLAAQVGIGGKTILEEEVLCYGQVGIAQNLHIGKRAVIAAQSGVSKSLEGGKIYFGSPAEEIRQHHRKMAILRQLPEFFKQFKS
ncbi:MAG: LpxD N-terminal domain-containing protein [Bacteroidota bacterium]